MLNFIKENSNFVVKMMINQFGLTVFGFMLAMAVGENNTLQLLTGLFAFGFYMFLLYSMTWTIGVKDIDRIANKRIPYIPLKGAYISVAANLINFIFAVGILIGFIITSASPSKSGLYGISLVIARFTQAMYLGINVNLPENIRFAMYFITPFPAIIACGLGYYLGVKEKRLLKYLGIDTSKNINKKNNNF